MSTMSAVQPVAESFESLETTQSSNPKTTYYYKLFRVRRSDGRVTTVSMNPVLVTQACRAMGGLRPVGQAVRTAALAYADGQSKNCSHFVSEQLRTAITRLSAERRAAAAAGAGTLAVAA
jgi:hypothetical protein